ncbi:MAG: GNAT family N-acetyltransferase [Thermoleophilia bacterium]|nr:GNAT family N-acetyltransferase [Thermoleophilia bacterium]
MIVCRQAGQEDLAGIVALLHEIMREHGVNPPREADLARTVSAILDSPNHQILVAEKNSQLVGMCACIFTLSTWSAAPVCELQDLIVSQSERRTQVGSKLIEAAREVARTRGCTRLFLLAEAWNFEAHAFYRRQGFQEKTCLYFELSL